MSDAPKRLLFVDDQTPVRLAATAVLRGRGYHVDEASSGAQVLELLRERKAYDLVILDLVMPGMAPWDVLRQISSMPGGPPVILTASEGEDIGDGAVTDRVLGYVRKPFAVGHLLETCASAIAATTRGPRPVDDRRRDTRRPFHVSGELLSASGVGLARCSLLDFSRDGFQVRADLPLAVGEVVAFAFRLPGKAQSLPLRGRILWREDGRLGVKVEPPARAHFDILTVLLGHE